MSDRSTRGRGAILCLLLILATLAAYWQVRHHDFTRYDDEDYVTRNPIVQQGITPAGLK